MIRRGFAVVPPICLRLDARGLYQEHPMATAGGCGLFATLVYAKAGAQDWCRSLSQ